MATLYDQYGRPIDLGRLKEEQAGPTVTGVRQVISGHPAQGLDPVRLARIMLEAEEGDPTRQLELAEEIEEKDLHYQGVLGTRRRAVSQLEITVEAASDSAEDVKAADLIREWLDRDTLANELFDVLDAIGKGYSFVEIDWDVSGKTWLPQNLLWRDPRWFAFDPGDGSTPKLIGEKGQHEDLVPYKYIHHVAKAKSGLKVRGGLIRGVAWMYLFKNFGIKDWMIFLNRFGMPMRIGKYSPAATSEERQTLLRAVRNIASDAAAIIPDGMLLEFVESKITGSTDAYENMLDFMDRQVSKAVLGQTLTTEVKGGSLAAANVHNDVREDIERADAMQLAAALNRDLVRPIIDLNFGPRKRYPRLRIGRPDQVNLETFVPALKEMVDRGMEVDASEMRDKFGLRDPGKDATLLRPAGGQPPSDGKKQPPPAETGKAAAAAGAGAPVRDEIDDLVDQLEEETAGAVDAMIGQIGEILDGSKTLAEAARRIEDIYPDMRPDELAGKIAEALAVADLSGRAEVF